ncbi:MAG: translational GTPase TypA [Phycisphaerales bacterium]|nr:translational GTPase TypA [Phycisphaerales bacterium]
MTTTATPIPETGSTAAPTSADGGASHLRNVAIIAHVDHGKTTLVDHLLMQSGMFRKGELEKLAGGQHDLIMDSNPLERERGITILSKNCAVTYVRRQEGAEQLEQFNINIIDTPGHADFGGEVERVLRMADGCLLLVDSSEGAMPQTRFVLSKAIEARLKPIVVVNKCDRPDARIQEVINEVFDLLVELGADDHALDFPIIYASGRNGWATLDQKAAIEASGKDHLPGNPDADMRPIFDMIVRHIPAPEDDVNAPLQMLITTLDYNDYVGRIGIGRVFNGRINSGQQVAVIKADGTIKSSKVGKLMKFSGLGRVETDSVQAGDICALIGLESVDIGDTIADPNSPAALPPVTVDEPTLSMTFRVNDSPFAGQDGDYVTSRQIRDRLEKELQHNVALKVNFGVGQGGEEFGVSGRGLLHLGILLETMRREGFELAVGKPQVIIKVIDGVEHEPIEWLVVDCPNTAVGSVMELVGSRRGEIKTMEPRGDASTHLEFEIPARGLIGLRSRVLTATQGEAIMHHTFERFAPVSGAPMGRNQGVLISLESGAVTHHACELLSDRGVLFVVPGDKVYAGQIVGEHTRDNDLVVNITRLKQLTNMRAASKEATVVLKQPRLMSLEASLEYIEDDELVEITPKSVRTRKRILEESMRKRAERSARDKDEAKA